MEEEEEQEERESERSFDLNSLGQGKVNLFT